MFYKPSNEVAVYNLSHVDYFSLVDNQIILFYPEQEDWDGKINLRFLNKDMATWEFTRMLNLVGISLE